MDMIPIATYSKVQSSSLIYALAKITRLQRWRQVHFEIYALVKSIFKTISKKIFHSSLILTITIFYIYFLTHEKVRFSQISDGFPDNIQRTCTRTANMVVLLTFAITGEVEFTSPSHQLYCKSDTIFKMLWNLLRLSTILNSWIDFFSN